MPVSIFLDVIFSDNVHVCSCQWEYSLKVIMSDSVFYDIIIHDLNKTEVANLNFQGLLLPIVSAKW